MNGSISEVRVSSATMLNSIAIVKLVQLADFTCYFSVCRVVLSKSSDVGDLPVDDAGIATLLNSRCYTFKLVQCIVPMSAGVIVKVVGIGTSNSTVCP